MTFDQYKREQENSVPTHSMITARVVEEMAARENPFYCDLHNLTADMTYSDIAYMFPFNDEGEIYDAVGTLIEVGFVKPSETGEDEIYKLTEDGRRWIDEIKLM